MPKYLSGRAKITPQSKLSGDRYKYLDLGSAEPNLGNPPVGGSPSIPSGEQFQIISVLGDDNEINRYWVPIQGGLIPGSISVFEEGSLVGTSSSITQLNFIGNSITAVAAPYTAGVAAGTIATMTVAPPGNNDEVLFKSVGIGTTSGDFATSSNLLFNTTAGILTSKQALNIGLGGTVFTAYSGTSSGVGVASVGIGTTNPSRALHVRGDLRLTGTIYDGDNTGGSTGDLLVKADDGSIEWKAPKTVQAGAGGQISQIQYHDDTGLVEGASNFVWIENASGIGSIGIGSTQPRSGLLMDVVGVASFSNIEVAGLSTFTGPVSFTSDIKVSGISTIDNLTNKEVVHVGAGSSLIGNSKFTFEIVKDDFTKLFVDDLTQLKNLNVTGVATIGNIEIAGDDDFTIKTTSGNLKLDATGGTIRAQQIVAITDTTESTDSTGALQVDGGGHFDKSLLVGGGLSVVGGAGTNIDPGEVIGVGVTLASARGITTTGGDLYVGGNLYVADDISLDEGIFNTLKVNQTSEFVGFATFGENIFVVGILTTTDMAGVGSLSVTGVSTFTGAIDANGGADISGGETTLSSATVSDLTDNRVVIAGTNGALEDDANFTFDASNLTVNAGVIFQRAGDNKITWNTTDDQLEFAQATKLALGDHLEILQTNNNSFIKHTNAAGHLYIRGDSIDIENKDGDETYIKCDDTEGVKLNYANVLKFNTTNDGVKITGGLQDEGNSLGTNGQILSSTGTALDWIDSDDLTTKNAIRVGVGSTAIEGKEGTIADASSLNSLGIGTYFMTFAEDANGSHPNRQYEYLYTSNLLAFDVRQRRVGIVSEAPRRELDVVGHTTTTDLSVAGTSHFYGNITLDAGLKDKDGELGTDGFVLKSTGSQVDWIDPSTIGRTYDLSVEQTGGNNDNPVLRLTDSSTNDDITITGGANVTVTRNSDTQLTIAADQGAGLALDTSVASVLDLTGGVLGADDAGADRIIFWDESESKLDHLTAGTGLTIDGTTITANTDAGKTYTLESSSDSDDVVLTLSDNASPVVDDPVTITKGSGITFSAITAGGFTISADTQAGTTYTLPTFGTTNTASGISLSGGGVTDNVNITGSGGITVVGNAGNNTLTIDGSSATGTTYELKCRKDSDGGDTGTNADPYLFLDASSGTDDAVQIAGTGGVSVTRNSDGKLTIDGASTSGTTYTLPLTGTAGDSGNAKWTLTPVSGTANSVQLNAGTNISISSLDTTGNDYAFTIDAVQGAGLALATTVDSVLDLTSGTLGADDPGADRIIFWDESAGTGKLEHLSVGAGLQIVGTELSATSAAGKTYDLSVEQTGDPATDANPVLRLGDGTTNDDITLTGSGSVSISRTSGTEITITGSAAGGLSLGASVTDILDLTGSTLSADDAGADKIVFWDDDAAKLTYLTVGNGLTISGTEITADNNGTVTDVTVDYTGRSAPCTLPITVTGTASKQINIPDSSNAFGAKYVQESEPTGSSVCEGDIWYDTANLGGSGAAAGTNRQIQFNDGGVQAGAANLEFYKSTTQPALILKPSDTSETNHGGYIRVQNSNASNWSEITGDGGLELFRSDNTHTYGGPYIDFKNVASGAPGDLDARIQMDHAASGSGASDANFSSITFTTGGGGLGVGKAEERLRIGKKGQLGIDGANYGAAGQVIKSTGATTSVEWSLVIPPLDSTTEVIYGNLASGAYTYRQSSASGHGIHHFQSDDSSTKDLKSYVKADGSYHVESDYRLKENVLSLTNGIETVKKLNPISFDWKGSGRSDIGFLAHELQSAVPTAVDGNKDQMKSDGVTPFYQFIAKDGILPHLTAALKEAIAKIETLEAKVAALESK